MSVSTVHIKDIIKGDGESKHFPFSFEVLENEQVFCIRVLANGSEVDILSTEFEVKLNQDVGGVVFYPLFDEALGVDEKIVIYRETSIKQDYSPIDGNTFSAKTIKKEIDRTTMISQELKEQMARAVKVSISGDGNPDDLMDSMNQKVEVARIEADRSKDEADRAEELVGKASYEADRATEQADRAKVEADRATEQADRAKGYADGIDPDIKANIDFSNINSENAHKLIGNRVWESAWFAQSNVLMILNHNLNISPEKIKAYTYIRVLTVGNSGFNIGDVFMINLQSNLDYSNGDFGAFLNVKNNNIELLCRVGRGWSPLPSKIGGREPTSTYEIKIVLEY